MATTIFHNPACGTSRKALAVIRATGTEPQIVRYLDAGWTRPQLVGLFAAAGMTPRAALRTKDVRAAELGLLDSGATDDRILDAMVAHPVLVERPFVSTAKGTALCRPLNTLLKLLENPLSGPVFDRAGKVILEP
ncbi:arsenate reductase [Yoonia tamlensis]|uniref:Arsenate reductase n=1 Tax=Yoonia tamlensis TaxID=390270 RepID=A0A1I6G3R6_9RHOB|nr:arsenate reductase (glutaredoxin) [Yoonia tamlensis]SFR36687.1 arsenate reductase [Yoonia tamlensis]